jgi:glycosyltransferase involved in cell wall biosynthesis
MYRVGIDVSCWSNRRGYGRFTRELLTALLKIDQENEYWFFADQQTAAEIQFPERANVVVAPTRVAPTVAASANGRRALSDVWRMSRTVSKHPLNLFFFPTIYSYFPVSNRSKKIVAVHDMTPTKFAAEIFPNKKSQFFWELKQRSAFLNSDHILTTSEYSKKEIMRYGRISSDRISVVTEGPGEAFRVLNRDSSGKIPNKPFLLYVGGISPHKNLRFLVKIFQLLIQDSACSSHLLVLAGDFKSDSFLSDYGTLQKLVNDLQIQDKVIFTGYVTDAELADLYNAAELLVFPSLQEGFGLPAVEAMACGTPIAASRAGSLPEIIGDAAEFFDPRNAEEALATIRRVLSDPSLRQRMQARGLERVKQFSWEKSAQQTLQVFDKLVKQ